MAVDPLAASLIEHTPYLSEDQRAITLKAYEFAKRAHEGQYRRSGEAYISHPVAVANILASVRLDPASLMGALLHDVIEDCNISKETISQEFSPTVADIVDGVSKISAIKFESHALAQAENFRKIMLAMTKDIRVILVKLADRLHNMRTLSVLSADKRRRIATETLEIYAPVANRLGMNEFRIEFEDLGFKALYPMRSQRLQKAIKIQHGNRDEIMTPIYNSLTQALEKQGIQARVIGREKHLYSVYQKMRKQRKSFRQIMDVYGFRLVVKELDDCYRSLGLAHNLFKPIPGRFKDYIAIPKINSYQSLHTTLKGPNGVPIEIQIRTEAMETMANNGIASHWHYKSPSDSNEEAKITAQNWLRGLIELQNNAGNSLEFIENVKIDLFPDEVYIFSPKGEIFELPRGATPVDFAFAVHTDIGQRCVAARIDQRLAPLSTPLESGQTVEIITSATATPNPAWLSFIVSGKARAKIKHFLKNQHEAESMRLGKRLLNKALQQYRLKLDTFNEQQLEQAASDLNAVDFNAVLQDIGLGQRIAAAVSETLAHKTSTDTKRPVKPLQIQGAESMVLHFAKCCQPIPGDSIMGFLSPGRGMVVHVDSCRNLVRELEHNPEKCLAVRWHDKVRGEFSTSLRIEMLNQRGVLATLANAIADSDANIETINMVEKDVQISVVHLTLAVLNRVHLARILRRLRALQSISKITRLKGQ
jgi:guanosine-3',5'-bis(diphosphate) 3'-pyrophosphohydrolase